MVSLMLRNSLVTQNFWNIISLWKKAKNTKKLCWRFFLHKLTNKYAKKTSGDMFSHSRVWRHLRQIQNFFNFITCENWHCLKSVQIQSYFWSNCSPNTEKYGPEITPHLYTFHAVRSKLRKTLYKALSP